MDYDVWTFNLSLANSQPDKPVDWFKLYRFSDIYGGRSLQPIEMVKVLYRMLDNTRLLYTYHRLVVIKQDTHYKKKCFSLKSRNSVDVNNSCGDSCRKKILCEILTPVYGDKQLCRAFLKQYRKNTLKDNTFFSLK